MSCFVFRIDPDCIIVFLENFIQNQRLFLRIGSSPLLKEVLKETPCSLLYSPLMPPAFEDERALEAGRETCYGQQIPGEVFLECCSRLGVDFSPSTVETFRGKTTIYLCGYPVTFFPDGNITIEEGNTLIFDLHSHCREQLHTLHDLRIVRTFHGMTYGGFYQQDGLLCTGDALFFFSGGKTGCITFSRDYLLAAARAGIDPEQLEFLCYMPGFDDSFWSTFFKYTVTRSCKINHFITYQSPPVEALLALRKIRYYETESGTVRLKLGEFTLLFQNRKLHIFYQDLKMSLNLTLPFSRGPALDILHTAKGRNFPLPLFFLDKSRPGKAGLPLFSPLILNPSGPGEGPGNQEQPDDTPGKGLYFYTLTLNRKNRLEIVPHSCTPYRLEDAPDPFSFSISSLTLDEVETLFGRFRGAYPDHTSGGDHPTAELAALYRQRFSTLLDTRIGFREELKKLNRIIMYTKDILLDNFPPVLGADPAVNEEDPALSGEGALFGTAPAFTGIKVNNRGVQQKKEGRPKKQKEKKPKEPHLHPGSRTARGLFLALGLSAVILVVFSLFFLGLRFVVPHILEGPRLQLPQVLEKSPPRESKLTLDCRTTDQGGFFMTLADYQSIVQEICRKNNFPGVKVKKNKLEIMPWWFYPGNVIIMPDDTRKVIKRNQSFLKLCEDFFIDKTAQAEQRIFFLLDEVQKGSITPVEARQHLEAIQEGVYSESLKNFIGRILTLDDLADYKEAQFQ